MAAVIPKYCGNCESLSSGGIKVYPYRLLCTQAGLFAAVESQLISYIKSQFTPDSSGNPGPDAGQPLSTQRAILIFSYAGLLFSCSAAVSSFILTDEFGELPIRAAKKNLRELEEKIVASPHVLLHKFGASSSWQYVMWHCE